MAVICGYFFFASFLSWMVVQLHKRDWVKMPREDDFLNAVRGCDLKPGNYAFPGCESHEEMKSEAFQQKMKTGPSGFITVFANNNMGKNLAYTFLYFFVVSFCLAYLGSLALKPGAEFMPVFRFMSTAAFLTFLSAIVAHAIWFHCRIVGHIIETIVFAAIVGALFGLLWPA